MIPTEEQLEARRLFLAGDSMVIEAGAGTGKTSTLRLLAASTLRRGRYVAFNKAIVTDVAGTMPARVDASTAHSLAFRYIGSRYRHRLGSDRMRSAEIADRLDIRRPAVVRYGAQSKVLQPSYLGGWTLRAVTRFCQTADDQPGPQHFPYIDGIDLPEPDGTRTYENNDRLRADHLPALEKAWADLRRTDGQLPFKHDHYLKLWQLAHPRIETDVIYFDECQDANPVMASVVGEQDHAQIVYVGDANQAIYEWTGAINAIDGMRAQGLASTYLSQSFRFGPAIAERANEILLDLGSPLLLTGLASISSEVGPIDGDPDAYLTRTNARAIELALDVMRRGKRPHVVGGGDDVLRFAKAADELQRTGSCWHPDLACFTSWREVLEYVEQDAQGVELRLLVKLVEDFGYATIESALGRMPREADADVLISTAHKAKGREWGSVTLASDFADGSPDEDAEQRLRYVAVTRARLRLDDTALREAEPEDAQGSLPDADI